MDHLPRPRDAKSFDWEKIPYICQEEYDGGPFLTYPLRVGKPQALPSAGYPRFEVYEYLHPTPVRELEAFLQTWLVFGLLHEVLGDLYTSDDFVYMVGNGDKAEKYLSTSKLLPLLDAQNAQIAGTIGDKAEEYSHIAECLSLTSLVLEVARHKPDFDPRIKVSIAAIGETLGYATNMVFKGRNATNDKCPVLWRMFFEESWLREAGWCPNEARRNMEAFSHLQTLFFLGTMQLTEPAKQHHSCTRELCTAHLNGYRTKHLGNLCGCEELTVNAAAVIKILEDGQLPLLQINNSHSLETLTVDITGSHENSRYVALSHVWADGMGNPMANALPRCQLQHLHQMVTALDEAADPLIKDEGNLLIWLDTLCCPVEPAEGKRMALAQMKRTYEDATYVLVLDSSLQVCDTREMSVVESFARIFTSRWMRRLWTLQEAALAKKLWFQFANGPLDLHQSWNDLRQIYCYEVKRKGLAIDMLLTYRKLKIFFVKTPGINPYNNIITVSAAVQHRLVSIASDEPLCLATLLSLDTKEILRVPESLRMHRLWSLMPLAVNGIPKDILFHQGPKLKEEGYRWAPATLLVSMMYEAKVKRVREVVGHQGTPTASGLIVRLSGCMISSPGLPQGLAKSFLDLLDSKWGGNYLLKHKDGVWYEIIYRDVATLVGFVVEQQQRTLCELVQEHPEGCALLISDTWPEPGDPKERSYGIRDGLIGKTLFNRNGQRYAQSKALLYFTPLRPFETELLKTAHQIAQSLLQDKLTQQAVRAEASQSEEEVALEMAALEKRILHKAEEALQDVKLSQVISHCAQEGKVCKLLATFITHQYLGAYGIMATEPFNDEEWCVD